MNSVLGVEHPLIQGQLSDINAQLKRAEESLTWNSQGWNPDQYYIFWIKQISTRQVWL